MYIACEIENAKNATNRKGLTTISMIYDRNWFYSALKLNVLKIVSKITNIVCFKNSLKYV